MADDLENPGQWRDTVETRLSTLEAKVEAEARLRAAMDEDLSGARADRNMLQALHDTQSEHTATLRQHTELLTQHTEHLAEHTEQLKDLQVGQQKVLAGIKAITDKLDTLIGDDGS